MLMILVQCILHKIQNPLSQYHLQRQLDVCISGVSSVIQRNSDNSEAKCAFYALIPCVIDHLWFTSDFRQVPRRNFLKFFPFFCPLLLLLQVSSFA